MFGGVCARLAGGKWSSRHDHDCWEEVLRGRNFGVTAVGVWNFFVSVVVIVINWLTPSF